MYVSDEFVMQSDATIALRTEYEKSIFLNLSEA